MLESNGAIVNLYVM